MGLRRMRLLIYVSIVTSFTPFTVHHVVTAAPSVCIKKWSAWINRNTPSTGDGDHESMTQVELIAFCSGGRVTKIDCQTTSGIPSYSSGEILTCSISNGLECLTANNFPIPCNDYKVRYYCDCQDSMTTDASTTDWYPSTPTTAEVTTVTTTKLETGTGDLQCMRPSQLARFCAGRCPKENGASVVYPIYRVLLVTIIMMLVFV